VWLCPCGNRFVGELNPVSGEGQPYSAGEGPLKVADVRAGASFIEAPGAALPNSFLRMVSHISVSCQPLPAFLHAPLQFNLNFRDFVGNLGSYESMDICPYFFCRSFGPFSDSVSR